MVLNCIQENNTVSSDAIKGCLPFLLLINKGLLIKLCVIPSILVTKKASLTKIASSALYPFLFSTTILHSKATNNKFHYSKELLTFCFTFFKSSINNMDLNLNNKVVLVTGAAGVRGSIGQTMVYELAKEGAIPVLIDRNDRGYEYEKELQTKGTNATFIKTDLSKPKQIEVAIDLVMHKYGRIDSVINNVGVNDGKGLTASVEEFISSLQLNLVSFFVVVKYALPALKASKGTILNIGSKVALTGQGGTSAYAAAKGGVLGLTREWAVDLIKDQIRVNAIIVAESWTPAYQTWIDSLENGEAKLAAITEKIPLENRMTTPEEIAHLALFTISDRSSHTTGQFIFVDGGYVHLDRALLTQ